VAVVLVVLGGVVLAAGQGTHGRTLRGHAAAAASVADAVEPAPPTPPTSVTSTTLAVSTSGAHASIATPPSYRIKLASHGPCWLRLTQAESRQVLLETTLQPGQQRQLDLNGHTHLRLGVGNTLQLSVNDQTVPLSGAPAGPYDIDFTATS
jgi:hypothetical protein